MYILTSLTRHRVWGLMVMISLLILLLPGCAPTLTKPTYIEIPANTSSALYKILYNRFDQAFVSYNLQTKFVEQQSNEPNYIVYEFGGNNQYYTAGNSIDNGFSILKRTGHSVTTVWRLRDRRDQAIFPLASSGSRLLFIQLYYNHMGAELKRSVVLWSPVKHELVPFKRVSGLVSYGVIIGDKLYYTVWQPMAKSYALYMVDVVNQNREPVRLLSHLQSGELYTLGRQLYVSNEYQIYNRYRSFTKRPLNYFFSNLNILVQIYVDANNDVALNVTDLSTDQSIGSAINVIDFDIQGHVLVVYGDGYIKKISV